ncbi:MAG: hypothetical protein DCC67_12735 [Planctomycetota bacterium]|nr:MAG: hypothetical protein DCC67_12735 [Planctomycetota bacterium]
MPVLALLPRVFVGCLMLMALGCGPSSTPGAAARAGEANSSPPAAPETFADEGQAPAGGAASAVETKLSDSAVRHTAAKPASRVDPVKRNGPIFEGWPKPELAIIVSGELDGYLEPCGCAGLENMLGGFKRRHTFLKQLADDGWPLVKLDLGGLVKRRGRQAEIKYRYILESLVEMGYDAVALGAHELLLDNVDSIAEALMNLPPEKNPVISANVGVYGLEESIENGMTRPYRVIEAGGKKIGVAAVLGGRQVAALNNRRDIGTTPPAEALAKVAAQLAAQQCDIQVLLVHGDSAEATALARQFPQFQIVAAAGGAEEPPKQPRRIEGSQAILLEPGHKGMYVLVLGVFDDPQQPVRYQRVPLDHRFADSPEMQAKLVAYQRELETLGWNGLGLTGLVHPDGDFAGSPACADCHAKAWEVWQRTKHHHAFETLAELDPPRQFDPECIACHVVGWNPQQYVPYATGYKSLEETPDMTDVGCESCHGPAAAHAKVESGEATVSEEEQEALRAALRMKIVPNEGNKDGQEFENGEVVKNCMQCHDQDNSPGFDFQKYWPSVEHPGKD